MNEGDRVHWADIYTFGGFEDYNVCMYSGTLGKRQGNGFLCTPDTGNERWVDDSLVQPTMEAARERAVTNAPEVIEDTRPTFGIGPDTRMTVGAVLQNKKKRKPRRRVSMADVAESLGLTRVRGALGGVYYE